MNMPRFTAEASLYQTNNHYRFTAGGGYLSNGSTTVTPQGCGWFEGGVCGTFITAGILSCTASCVAGPATGGIPCYLCWTGVLGGLFGFCRNCIPAWMRALVDLGEGGGGGGDGATCSRATCPPRGSLPCCSGYTCSPEGVCIPPGGHIP
jgi:hypothetical protein